jgi:phenylacetate-coenzyme A ligase PaaK-like adenylate-forming protein
VAASFSDRIFQMKARDFTGLALEAFAFQYENNPVYKAYSDSLGLGPEKVKTISQIPFLPIGLFKSHSIQTTSFEPEMIFESSGTTQAVKSRHFVKDLTLYQKSFTSGFEKFYGQASQWCILGLLPSYLEKTHSSLVSMVGDLIDNSAHWQSGFYLYDHQKLYETLLQLEKREQKTILIGVTFALLDFAEKFEMKLEHTVIMETGGMKGRREELTRPEVHDILKRKLGVQTIHSEYGMTELLSQAYSKGEGLFQTPPWMKIMVRAEDDPTDVKVLGSGILNVIDLPNIYSCCFISTDDVGRVEADGRFEVWGRMDYSDIRGCNLMVIA